MTDEYREYLLKRIDEAGAARDVREFGSAEYQNVNNIFHAYQDALAAYDAMRQEPFRGFSKTPTWFEDLEGCR